MEACGRAGSAFPLLEAALGVCLLRLLVLILSSFLSSWLHPEAERRAWLVGNGSCW